MTIRARHLVALCAAFAALALPAVAQADPDAVVRDCAADGTVDGEHSDADKRAALNRIPTELDVYSDCRSAIRASIGGSPKAGASSNGGGGGAGAAAGTAAAKAKQARKRKARAERREKKREATEAALGDRNIDPRNPDVLQASETSNGLPTPILLALIALGLLGAAAAVIALGRRNLGPAAMLRRVSVPFLRR